jgi:hypothetical protein
MASRVIKRQYFQIIGAEAHVLWTVTRRQYTSGTNIERPPQLRTASNLRCVDEMIGGQVAADNH